jgi:DNA-binding NarL/FixJ family response regulator
MTPPNSKSLQFAKGNRSLELTRKIPIKIALVEDQPKARASWTKFINTFPDFACVCACATGEEALRVIPPLEPDVILMDLFLPRMSGIECTVRLKELLPQTQIIILTAMDDEDLVFLALEAGANGYLLKRTKPSDLRTALLDVLGGGAPMTSEIARHVIESFRQKAQNRYDAVRLTMRGRKTEFFG